jgi:hypothetical protein
MRKLKTILFIFLGLVVSTTANAEPRPMAEILEYGIYSDTHLQSVVNTNAPTGKLFLGAQGMLERRTNIIPAKLKSVFGFRFVVHGRLEDGPIQLHMVYLYPNMEDPVSGKNTHSFEANFSVKPEDRNPVMQWGFTEPFELVTGEWTFRVFCGNEMILEKKFEVVKADEN